MGKVEKVFLGSLFGQKGRIKINIIITIDH